MAASQQGVLNLAEATTGRAPGFTSGGPAYFATKPPASSSDMLSIATSLLGDHAVTLLFELLLREDASKKTARVTVGVYSVGTTYTVTVDGEAHTSVAAGDIESAIDALLADVNAGRAGAGTETEYGRSTIEVDSYDVGTTYTITVNSWDHESLAAGSATLAAEELASAINSGPYAAHVTAVAVAGVVTLDNNTGESYDVAAAVAGGAGTVDFVIIPATATRTGSGDSSVLLIVGTHAADYTITVGEAGGDGWISLAPDAASVTFEIYGLSKGRSVPCAISGNTVTETANYVERLSVAGLEYIQCVIIATDGRVTWAVGPCDLEA